MTGPVAADGMFAALVGLARGAGGDGQPRVLSRRAGAAVVRVGAVVAKAHRPGTDTAALAARLQVAAHPLAGGVLLAPTGPPRWVRGRPVTLWPAGEPVDPDRSGTAPWAVAGALLARLHALDPGAFGVRLPPSGGPARLARALRRLDTAAAAPGATQVRAAWQALAGPPAVAGPPPSGAALVHGDWHLGQLVCAGGWRLVDVDDLGTGDPAWDLGRPASWYATGLLPDADWHAFLDGYRDAGGPALPAGADPWPVLDAPARALTVQTAAQAVVAAWREGRPLDPPERALVDTCGRIGRAGRAGPAGIVGQ